MKPSTPNHLLDKTRYEAQVARTRAARMKWWHEARYGMFVHWGLYSLIGRHEWAMAFEAIPQDEYDRLADQFRPAPHCARAWARLAREAGMKYMVLTAKHHEGFCLWDTQQTDFNAVRRGPKRDLVGEYVAACREFGLRVGLYYSLMDWRHPDGTTAAHDPAARRRFLDFTQGCLRELMTNYGRIDILWYDYPSPFHSPEGWDALAMNQMVRALQPQIIINSRACLEEDFANSEERVVAEKEGRGWEACMTFNHASWGYMPSAACDAHTARDILRMFNTVCAGQGNFLLNIGPAPDGRVPREAIKPLQTVGRWLRTNGAAVYGALDRAPGGANACGNLSRKGNQVYFWVRYWPGREMGVGGFRTRLRAARFLVGGRKVDFEQTANRILFKNLPRKVPDRLAGVTVIELDFAAPPKYSACPTTPALHV